MPVLPAAHALLVAVAPVLERWAPRDLEDAGALWRTHGDAIDTARIRAVLRQLEDALSQNHLVPAFEAIGRPARPAS